MPSSRPTSSSTARGTGELNAKLDRILETVTSVEGRLTSIEETMVTKDDLRFELRSLEESICRRIDALGTEVALRTR